MKNIKLLLFSMMLSLASCASVSVDEQPADAVRVTTDSSEFMSVTRAMNQLCQNPAEFGRCGCYMNDVVTSCAAVANCLEAGFCVPARKASAEVTTQSESYRKLASTLVPQCNNPAEFGRCDCSMDGIKVSCDIANRCLTSGFCNLVSEQ